MAYHICKWKMMHASRTTSTLLLVGHQSNRTLIFTLPQLVPPYPLSDILTILNRKASDFVILLSTWPELSWTLEPER